MTGATADDTIRAAGEVGHRHRRPLSGGRRGRFWMDYIEVGICRCKVGEDWSVVKLR